MKSGAFDFRTPLCQRRLPIYFAADGIGFYPSRLSLNLNNRLPVPQELWERFTAVFREHLTRG